jgi:YgiT-type zinc finger domain-containing protein
LFRFDPKSNETDQTNQRSDRIHQRPLGIEKVIEIEFKWKGRLYVVEGVPTGVCQQCGEKYFTSEVSSAIDQSVKEGNVKRMVDIPVLELGFSP